MLILVRLVEPSAFGLFALAMTVIAIANQLQGAGLSSAVIYHRDDLEERAATAVVLVIASSIVLYAVTLAAAPLIADFFGAESLTNVLRALAGALVLTAIARIPAALLEREVQFDRRARVELAAAVVQLGVAVGTAAIGWGVWALVVGQLAAASVLAVGNWILVPWRPNLRRASRAHVRTLVGYGRFVTGGNLLNIAGNTVDNVAVGRFLGTAAVGFYAITFRLADFPNSVIGYIVGRVMFPVYAMLQGNLTEFRRAYVQNLQRVALLAFPVSVTLAVAAEPLVIALLGEKWRPVIEPLQILAVYGLVKSMTAPAGEVFKGIGRPSVNFALGIANLAILVPALILLVPRYDLKGAAFAMLAATALAGSSKLWLSMRALDLSAVRLAAALAPAAVCSVALGVALVVLQVPVEPLSPLVSLLVLVAGGFGVYVVSTAIFARSIVAPAWASLRGLR
jgi:O-antigen/teichoic acid export membrane protein